MSEVEIWLIVRDGIPVHARLTEGEAEACRYFEERTFHHDTVKVVKGVFNPKEE